VKESVLDIKNVKVSDVELADDVFASKPNQALIYEVVKMQRAGWRKGTVQTKNRAAVRGTTAKMYRQKGTGRARHGSKKVGLFVGGGKAFGPHPRDYSYKIPKKARRGGLRSALVIKKNEGKMLIVDSLAFPEIKTKDAIVALNKLGVKSGLLVIDGVEANLAKSVSNIPNIKVVQWEGLNVYDLMKYEHAVLTVQALEKVQEVLKP
jgi:large subunit ribosomal protein L4